MLGRVVLFSSLATIFAGTSYVAAISLAPPPTYTVSDAERIVQYNHLASTYEQKTRQQEFYLGIGRWRRRILRGNEEANGARGRVLEVGAGSGSNIGLYPADCTEVVLCDRAPAMVEAAVAKIQHRLGYEPFRYPPYDMEAILSDVAAHPPPPPRTDKTTSVVVEKRSANDGSTEVSVRQPGNGGAGGVDALLPSGITPIASRTSTSSGRLEVLSKSSQRVLEQRAAAVAARTGATASQGGLVGDAKVDYTVANYAAEQLPFPDNSFDTVVDMFGLCSYDDPVRSLREMSRVCKPDGVLLLIEHGRGRRERINTYLDKWAPRHARMWGCWWNRDIRRYLRLAGIHTVVRDEKHFGTSQLIVAKPFKSMEEKEAYEAGAQQ